jgi:GNAT superfamily N-acetyltransferase
MRRWRIRRAVPADAPAIWAIHTRAIRETASSHYAPETVVAWSGRMTPASYAEPIATKVVIVAEDDDGRLAGFAELDPVAGIVLACYVDPDFDRQGVGRSLMNALEAEARAHGRSALLLDASVNAIAFYESLGWRVEARARHDLGHGASLECAVMAKKIA